MKMPGKCEGPRVVGKGTQPLEEKMEKSVFERARHGNKSGSEWRGFGVGVESVQGVPSGTEAGEPL